MEIKYHTSLILSIFSVNYLIINNVFCSISYFHPIFLYFRYFFNKIYYDSKKVSKKKKYTCKPHKTCQQTISTGRNIFKHLSYSFTDIQRIDALPDYFHLGLSTIIGSPFSSTNSFRYPFVSIVP